MIPQNVTIAFFIAAEIAITVMGFACAIYVFAKRPKTLQKG
jgi:hypothetical protein